jgi:hypothetical protein
VKRIARDFEETPYGGFGSLDGFLIGLQFRNLRQKIGVLPC